jgi:transposase InsO family protein
MAAVLRRDGWSANRKRVKRLMRVMGLEAIYQKPNTSRSHPGHKVYPYLLRSLVIDRPNQVWCADITYIPMAKGFVYLVAVMDWFGRPGAGVAGVDHHGSAFCRGIAGGDGSARTAGHLQHRARGPVH